MECVGETDASDEDETRGTFGEDGALPTVGNVFWTKSGSVFHLDPLCRYLSSAKEIYYGTAEDATTQGKERVCTACEKEQ